MPLAVLDTNVVLDWLVFDDPGVQALAGALSAGRLQWITTAAMLDELAAVLKRPALACWTPKLPAAWARATAASRRVVAPPLAASRVLWCSDPDDQKFIDLALAWPTAWLFSRDRALLKLARRAQAQGLQVSRPADARLAS